MKAKKDSRESTSKRAVKDLSARDGQGVRGGWGGELAALAVASVAPRDPATGLATGKRSHGAITTA